MNFKSDYVNLSNENLQVKSHSFYEGLISKLNDSALMYKLICSSVFILYTYNITLCVGRRVGFNTMSVVMMTIILLVNPVLLFSKWIKMRVLLIFSYLAFVIIKSIIIPCDTNSYACKSTHFALKYTVVDSILFVLYLISLTDLDKKIILFIENSKFINEVSYVMLISATYQYVLDLINNISISNIYLFEFLVFISMFIVMYEENVILSLIEVILVSLSLGFSQYGISNWVYYLYMFTLIGFLRQKNLKGLVLGLIICSAMLYQPLFECNGFSRSCDNNVCLTKLCDLSVNKL